MRYFALILVLMGLMGCQRETLLVAGIGTAQSQPDFARFVAYVEGEGATPEAAIEKMSNVTSRLIDGLLAEGLERSDISTFAFAVDEACVSREVEGTRRYICEGYEATQPIQVTVRDVSKIGLALSIVAKHQARSEFVEFAVNDQSSLDKKAREAAIDDALAKAEDFASQAQRKPGRVIAIEDSQAAASSLRWRGFSSPYSVSPPMLESPPPLAEITIQNATATAAVYVKYVLQ